MPLDTAVEKLLEAQASLTTHLGEHAEYTSQEPANLMRRRLHMAAQALERASKAPTMFAVLINLDATLGELAEALAISEIVG